MEISKINIYRPQSCQRVQEQQRQLRGEESTRSRKTSTAVDRVELSNGYQEINQLKRVMMERDELRANRVDQLRNLIECDRYELDPVTLAAKMLEEIWP
jgi:flagellar biosynthesis anti-sigma factor FlgM